MKLPNHTPEDVSRLVLAARAALLQLDGELFSIKQSLRAGDGDGGLRPFDRRALSLDDRQWFESIEAKVSRLNEALAAFDAAVSNPASI